MCNSGPPSADKLGHSSVAKCQARRGCRYWARGFTGCSAARRLAAASATFSCRIACAAFITACRTASHRGRLPRGQGAGAEPGRSARELTELEKSHMRLASSSGDRRIDRRRCGAAASTRGTTSEQWKSIAGSSQPDSGSGATGRALTKVERGGPLVATGTADRCGSCRRECQVFMYHLIMCMSDAMPPYSSLALRLSMRLSVPAGGAPPPPHRASSWRSLTSSCSAAPGTSRSATSHRLATALRSQCMWHGPGAQPLVCAAIIHTSAGSKPPHSPTSSSATIGRRRNRSSALSSSNAAAAHTAARLCRRRTAFCSSDFSIGTSATAGGSDSAAPSRAPLRCPCASLSPSAPAVARLTSVACRVPNLASARHSASPCGSPLGSAASHSATRPPSGAGRRTK
mmetsp:Transcript_44614/g.114017  ORF Transcript_44614/g.114017 Transcript_44614/m.114017 type:complete len:401 (+) Transcript_44614:791-1993(+)